MKNGPGFIERGVIRKTLDGGYIIASLDREGIETPPILPIDDRSYSEGDRIYYFYFPDGTGRILCRI